MTPIEFPLSKKKILLTIGGSLAFIAISIYFTFNLADNQTRFDPTLLKAAGIAGMLFFSATTIYGIKKIFDKKTGFIINDEGITDNTNASSIGLIPWNSITDIRTENVMSTRFLLIYISDPASIIDKSSGFKKKLLQSNMNLYGTPLSITATTLAVDFDALEKILHEAWHKNKSDMPKEE